MKILWVINGIIPLVSKLLGVNHLSNAGGWLHRLPEGLLEQKDVCLCICYPISTPKTEEGQYENLVYHGIYFEPDKLRNGTLKSTKYVPGIKRIIETYNPDVVHIHGTEFQFSLFFIEALKELNKIDCTVISIQGLVSFYAMHYTQGIPIITRYMKTVREIVLKNNIADGKKSFVRRGKSEISVIQNVHHVIGRTTWDRACTFLLNPTANYHICNESLRKEFYSGQWTAARCQPHSIFVSQASYPVKGFHMLLSALGYIKRFYPEVQVRVAGENILKRTWIKGSSYGMYIRQLIKKYGLEENVKFLGSINAEKMKDEMLKSNVFVSPSSIENSPNSLGEAMLLGVPVVSSDVGGVTDMLAHRQEGFVYPFDAPYMLAFYIIEIFKNPLLAEQMGKYAHEHARQTHDFDNNLKTLIDIYRKIMVR